MMAKSISHYVCQQCGRTAPQYMGRCPSCGGWGTMLEEVIPATASPRGSARGLTSAGTQPRRLSEVSGNAEERLALPINEFARVLGGGVVPGSIVLVGGDPGIGKSTLV
ncbi:MAG: DNA repair protein RadA, partial [Anaerolineales bacterium]